MFARLGVQGETDSEQFRDFLEKLHRAERLDTIASTPSNPAMHPTENITVLKCPLRKEIALKHYDKKTGAILWTEKKLFCIDNPPHTTELKGLGVCEVCIEKFYGLAKKLRAVEPATVEPVKVGQKPTPQENEPEPEPAKVEEVLPAGFVFNSMVEWRKVAFVQKSNGARFCPFSLAMKYSSDCTRCEKQIPVNFTRCRTLRLSPYEIATTQKK